jgi:sugar phosphate isomerase/epimerase
MKTSDDKATSAGASDGLRNKNQDALFAPANLLAWCIVPYDSRHRTPAERIAMLQRLGFTQYAWDWRQPHLKDLPEEIKLSRDAGVRIRAVWLWIDESTDRPGQLSAANRAVIDAVVQARLSVEYWVGFNANFFAGLDDAARVKKGAAMVEYLRQQASLTDGTVALYNHGDWFGEPDNEIKIIKAAGERGLGIIYNLHHAEGQLDRFADLLTRMRPYLRAVNLNGVRPGALDSEIIPLGQGTLERGLIRTLKASGYDGPIGILGHTEGEDVEEVLRRNLDGLRAIEAGK